MLDLKKMHISDKAMVEDVLPSQMLLVAVSQLVKDNNLNRMDPMWVNLLYQSCLAPVSGLSKDRLRKISHIVSDLSSRAFRGAGNVSTYSELMLATALMILHFVRDHRIVNVQSQGVLIASMIVDEASDHGDVADLRVARTAADKMQNVILEQGYFSVCH